MALPIIAPSAIPPSFMFRPSLENLVIEFIYFAIVAGLCLLIYRKTKEIYTLTKHRGIHFFRNIFLYFSLAYFFRLLFAIGILSREAFDIDFSRSLPIIGIVLSGLFSTLAIISLLLVVAHPRIRDSKLMLAVGYTLAFLLSVLVFITHSNGILILIQTILLAVGVIFAMMRDGKFMRHNRITFFLLMIFWLANALAFSRRILPPYLRIPLYILSIGVFFSIYTRVNKRISDATKA